MSVYKAINAVQTDLAKEGIGKTQTNTFDNYKFRGIDDIYNALSPLLAKHGLCILPRVLSRICEERTSKKGDALFYVTVDVEFDFVAADDASKHTVRVFGEAMDRGDKATNKAMSAAYKYGCFEVFCIPTEGEDADAVSHEVAAKPVEKVSSKRIVDDVWESITEAQRHRLTDLALTVTEYLEMSDVAAAIKALDDAELDADEKTAIWSRFDSKQRSAIKGLRHDQKRAAMIEPLKTIAKTQERLQEVLGSQG